MAKFGASLFSGVALFALASSAMAADLLPPPPAVDLPLPPAASGADVSGWYLRGDVGVGVNSAPTGLAMSPDPIATGQTSGFLSANATNTFNNSSLGESQLYDVGVGYQFNNWLRADVTGELRGGAHFQSLEVVNDPTFPGGTTAQFADFYRGNVSTYLAMVNGYADIGTWSGVTPYVGAGIGMSYTRMSGFTDTGANQVGAVNTASGGYFANGSKASYAWALMTGLDFKVTQNLTMELGYRYLNYGGFKTGGSNCLSGGGPTPFSTGNCGGAVANVFSSARLGSSDLRLGFRYLIGDNSPAPAPGPIVRKY